MSAPVPDGLVRIFPVRRRNLPDGVALKVQDVDPEVAEQLTAERSRNDPEPWFVTDPALIPEGWTPPDPDHLITDPEGPEPDVPATPRRASRPRRTRRS